MYTDAEPYLEIKGSGVGVVMKKHSILYEPECNQLMNENVPMTYAAQMRLERAKADGRRREVHGTEGDLT